MLDFRAFVAARTVIGLGVTYDNNNATLLRSGVTYIFGSSAKCVGEGIYV